MALILLIGVSSCAEDLQDIGLENVNEKATSKGIVKKDTHAGQDIKDIGQGLPNGPS